MYFALAIEASPEKSICSYHSKSCKVKNSPDYVPSIFNHKEIDAQSSQASKNLSALVSEPQASSGYEESTFSFEASEATGSSGPQALSDGESEDEEPTDTVSEADEVVTEDMIEVVNLDFF